MILERGHESVIEHASATVKFIHNRGFTHELVRHRLASFSQESTRYCNYGAEKHGSEITVIAPYWTQIFDVPSVVSTYCPPREESWFIAIKAAESAYIRLLEAGLPPQAARGVLPNDLKTEIVMTANLREWRHIFKLRTSDAAHPDMRRVMRPLLAEFQKRVPVLFDIGKEE